jgi:hypothetical protein
MSTLNYTLKGILLSVTYWIMEMLIHGFLFNEEIEIFPSDANELWMRGVIIFLLVGFGIYADRKTRQLLAREEETRKIYLATVTATQHVMNNFLNQMQIFRLEAEKKNRLNDGAAVLLDQLIRESAGQIQQLASVKELTEENIKKSVFPEQEYKGR